MSKVYDCFTINDELDLLEVRLHTLNTIVDYYILIEGEKSWQNNEKSLFYNLNKEQFSMFKSKIIHLTMPAELFSDNPWENEKKSFNYAKHGLNNAEGDDLVCISAIDEIPNPNVIAKLRNDLTAPSHLNQKFFYYFFNTIFKCPDQSTNWPGTFVCSFKTLREQYWDDLYEPAVRQRKRLPLIEDGGWHFSFCGGLKKIKSKLKSYSHSEFSHIQETEINDRLEKMIDPLGRQSGMVFHSYESVSHLPEYIQNNLQKFSDYIKQV